MLFASLLLCAAAATSAFSLTTTTLTTTQRRRRLGRFSSDDDVIHVDSVEDEDTSPSDTGSYYEEEEAKDVDEAAVLALCAATGRGAFASDFDRADVDALCRDLETRNPRKALEGRWLLAYSSEPGLYRSSPFFWGFKKLLNDFAPSPVTLRNAKDNSYAENIYAVTDSIPFYDVGSCVQTISGASFVSEVEVKVKLFDSLLPTARSVMTTTARTSPTPDGLRLTLETTAVKDSSLEQLLPAGLLNLGDLAFPTENAFKQLADGDRPWSRFASFSPDASTVALRAPYVSDTLRITRTDSGMLFVHVKDDASSDFF